MLSFHNQHQHTYTNIHTHVHTQSRKKQHRGMLQNINQNAKIVNLKNRYQSKDITHNINLHFRVDFL